LKFDSLGNKLSRRDFLRWTGRGFLLPILNPFSRNLSANPSALNDIFWIRDIPHHPFVGKLGPNSHAGMDCLLHVMADKGLKLYRSNQTSLLSSPLGMIGPEDVVLIKVNAQWKYRGCTNSDIIRGLIQRILDHPDGFSGEVVIFENGQGKGSLYCDRQMGKKGPIYPDSETHANAEDESHSFMYLVDEVFRDSRVSAYLLDPIRKTFIGDSDHVNDGYRIYENVSYPCFTTDGGHRIELREGVWNGSGHDDKIKLINVPVLKHHDKKGSYITASLKNFYGVVSMGDGQHEYRHYTGLGETCGKMVASVKTPILNIIDAIWVPYIKLRGYPHEMNFRANEIVASQDPVALDYWAAKYVLYPIDRNEIHHPDFPGIDYWLTFARDTINSRGGLYNSNHGIFVRKATKDEQEMNVHERSTPLFMQERLEEIIEEARSKRWKVIK
jgi:hypothetical protein